MTLTLTIRPDQPYPAIKKHFARDLNNLKKWTKLYRHEQNRQIMLNGHTTP